MKQWRRQITIILVVVFALGVGYIFCIPCQFFGWMPMPNVSEVRANPKPRPIHFVDISNENFPTEKLLCVHISKAAFVKQTGNPHGMLADLPAQIVSIEQNFEKSFKFFVDGWRKQIGTMALSDIGPFIKCVDMTDAKQDQHVAYIQYNDLDGVAYSYTWVFQVKADGIVPEVTATPS